MGITFTGQRGDTLNYSGQLTVTTCWCGVPQAIPKELYDYAWSEFNNNRRVNVFCPLGHNWNFAGESELDRTKKALEREGRIAGQRLERLEAARRETEHERRSHAATKGHQTRLKKRIAGGACPCCNRTFVNLERHMTGQHPEYVKEEDT
jgi:hypothetical protein